MSRLMVVSYMVKGSELQYDSDVSSHLLAGSSIVSPLFTLDSIYSCVTLHHSQVHPAEVTCKYLWQSP